MNPPSVPHGRPENMTELVEAYLQAPGVIIQRSLPTETLRVPFSPTYNTKFILKRFQSCDDLFDEIAAMEHARSAFNSWMPGSHIVPDTYWKSEPSAMIAMEHIPGTNGSEVGMGFWTRSQRRGFVRQMAVIGICLIWGVRDRASETSTEAMFRRGLRHKSAAAYDREGIDEFFSNALSGIFAPPGPLLRNFRFIRPCEISLRGSKIVAITGWGSMLNWRGGQGAGDISGLDVLNDTPPPGYEALGGPDWDTIRAYSGRIREADFMEALSDDESDICDGEKESEGLPEDWYHQPVWQLVSECVCRCELRAKPVPIGEYLGWAKRDEEGFRKELTGG
ncbi:hypothetical protein B9Z19DRAFT_1157591 [Tuber borchii]|uniref:Aminoglycoside phosphotransferase domain-containing protein n=1 Tax=Tuber borchii TaxID=42251 RepID=A0A2T6ZGK8_TUBBO|nr:hypothetical protein B9Z19DRAFT_1157591 [Tuber borchii]